MRYFFAAFSRENIVRYLKPFLLGMAILFTWGVVVFSLMEARDANSVAEEWRERSEVYATLLEDREKELQAAEKDIVSLEQRQSALASEKAKVEDRQELYRDLSSDLESVIRAERACRSALLAVIAGEIKKSSPVAEVICKRADRAIERLSGEKSE